MPPLPSAVLRLISSKKEKSNCVEVLVTMISRKILGTVDLDSLQYENTIWLARTACCKFMGSSFGLRGNASSRLDKVFEIKSFYI